MFTCLLIYANICLTQDGEILGFYAYMIDIISSDYSYIDPKFMERWVITILD